MELLCYHDGASTMTAHTYNNAAQNTVICACLFQHAVCMAMMYQNGKAHKTLNKNAAYRVYYCSTLGANIILQISGPLKSNHSLVSNRQLPVSIVC